MITETIILLLTIPVMGFFIYVLFFVFGNDKFPITPQKRIYRVLIKISFLLFWPLYFLAAVLYYSVSITRAFIISFFE